MTAKRAIASALVAGALVALVDTTWADLTLIERVRLSLFLRALGASAALYLAAALAIGAGEALLLAGLRAMAPLPRAWRRLRASMRTGGDLDRSVAVALIATAGALVGLVLPWLLARRGIALVRLRHARLSALAAGVAAAIVLALVAIAAARRVLTKLPPPRAWIGLVVLAIAIVTVPLLVLGSLPWRSIDFGPAEMLLLFAILQLAIFLLARRLPLPPSRTATRTMAVVAPAIAAVCAIALVHVGAEPRALDIVEQQSRGARLLLAGLRRLADHDGDGYSARFGDRDCNDHDARINPAAVDVPGNGVDEDCDGLDAPAHTLLQRPDPPSPAAGAFRFRGNFVIITIDALRADRLTPSLMPRLSAFAAGAVRFAAAYAQAPHTARSFPSFITSRLPSHVKWTRYNADFSPLQPVAENRTFFEALHDAGWRTIGIFSHPYLDAKMGMARGFDEWHDDDARRLSDVDDVAAPRITARVVARLEKLRSSSQRFVLWTHLFEPHNDYVEHPEFPVPRDLSPAARLAARYDGEVRFVDRYVGIILDALARTGLAADTAVVVLADHGEAFGEHSLNGQPVYYHGRILYDEVLRVPLVVSLPGVAPRVVDDRVALIDLGPTLLDAAKVTRPPNFEGRSLLRALLGEPLPPRPVAAEVLPTDGTWRRLRAIVDGDWKLIVSPDADDELYDLARDPGERIDLAGRDPARVQQLKSEIGEIGFGPYTRSDGR